MSPQDPNFSVNPYGGFDPISTPPVVGDPGIASTQLPGKTIQYALNQLEELVLNSYHFPFISRTLVNEDLVLEQIDHIRSILPGAFQAAEDIIQQRDDVLLEANDYAQEIIQSAQREAMQILDELGIIQQANWEAQQIRQRVQEECEALQQKTIQDIEQLQQRAQQDFDRMREVAMAEAKDIQFGADAYADHTLQVIERQLTEMMRIVRNGRQELQIDASPSTSTGQGNGSVNHAIHRNRN